jgi:S1-C subfamily serine protease
MKARKIWQKVISHGIALVMGVVLCFSGFRTLSSAAEPIAPLNPTSIPVPQNLAQIPLPANKESFVAAAVDRTGLSVVRIDTETVVTQQMNPAFEDPFFREFFGGGFGSPRPQKERISGQGSGFIIDPQGVILTNAHVVDKADKVTVTLKDGRIFNGIVSGTDDVTDLAVVKINAKGEKLPVAPLGDSSLVRVGDWAIAVGNPVGLDNTVTLGIISTIGRSAAKVGIPDKRVDFLQTDAAINPGNSGGPLLNADGEVIGINTAIRSDAMGIGFAIPINKAKSLEEALASGKKVPHPYIGVKMVNLTPEIAQENNQNPNSPFEIPEVTGILIVQVLPNAPAQAAGLRRGDVILAANGKPVKDGGELQNIVENAGLNQSLKLKVQRGDRILDLTVRTAQMESQS